MANGLLHVPTRTLHSHTPCFFCYRSLAFAYAPKSNYPKRWLKFLGEWCLRCLLLVMCTHPFAKKALTLHLARSEGHESYFGCNLMHSKVLASSHPHLMAEAPTGD